MHSLPPKRCPDCGAGYVHTAQRCSDCNVELILDSPPDERPAALPEASELSALVRGGPWELERIAEALSSAGIPSRIESDPPGQPIYSAGAALGNAGFGLDLCVYVLPESFDRAERTLEQHRAQSLQEPPPASELGQVLESCPACGADFDGSVTECPDCGLEFVAETYTCPCGAPVSAGQGECSACGEPLDEGAA